jgi:ferredoxin
MAFVVKQNCTKCEGFPCVAVCPVDAFHEGPRQLVIDPNECIDCTLCEPECPVNAICAEDELPAEAHESLRLNAEWSAKHPRLQRPTSPE